MLAALELYEHCISCRPTERTGTQIVPAAQFKGPAIGAPPPLLSEQTILRASIAITIVVAFFGIVFGLLSGRSPSPLTASMRLPEPA